MQINACTLPDRFGFDIFYLCKLLVTSYSPNIYLSLSFDFACFSFKKGQTNTKSFSATTKMRKGMRWSELMESQKVFIKVLNVY